MVFFLRVEIANGERLGAQIFYPGIYISKGAQVGLKKELAFNHTAVLVRWNFTDMLNAASFDYSGRRSFFCWHAAPLSESLIINSAAKLEAAWLI